jgi:hypothetical protein
MGTTQTKVLCLEYIKNCQNLVIRQKITQFFKWKNNLKGYFTERRYIYDRQEHEKIFSVTSHQKNA